MQSNAIMSGNASVTHEQPIARQKKKRRKVTKHRCPPHCTLWDDGCNVCNCKNGFVSNCSVARTACSNHPLCIRMANQNQSGYAAMSDLITNGQNGESRNKNLSKMQSNAIMSGNASVPYEQPKARKKKK